MPESAQQPRRRVAFLDDDLQFLNTTKLWQQAHGLPEKATSEPARVLEWVRKDEVDAVISDLRMPGISGVDFMEQVHSANPKIQKYLLTGFDASPEEDERLKRVNVLQFTKPQMESLLDRLVDEGNQVVSNPEVFAATEQALELQARVETLELFHRLWLKDLIEDLEAIPDANRSLIFSGEETYTVEKLVEDIRNLTPRGLDYVRLWRNAQATGRRMGKR